MCLLFQALNELGLIDWISAHVRDIVMGVDPENRMLVAILLILWVAAIASSFIDNIPFTTAMVRLIYRIYPAIRWGFGPLE